MGWLCVLAILILVYWVYEHKFVKIVRFYRPTCRYCIDSEDDWKKFKRWSWLTRYSCREVNLSDPGCGQVLIDKFKVTSVPTIILIDCDGRAVKHTGSRDTMSLIRWARTNG